MKKIFKILLFFFAFCLFTFHLQSQWLQQSIPVSKPVTGIKFLNTLTGWACTSYGTQQDTGYVLHTTNGGTNWNVQFKKYASSFECLSMVNAGTGYIGGYNFDTGAVPLIMKTTNSGVNWFNLNANVSSGVTDIFFINPDSGYSCSQLFINVYTTTNGGLSWALRTSGINQTAYRLFFLNYNTGYCGGATNLYKTTNAGLSWSLQGAFGETVYAVFFFNEQIGYLGLSGGKVAKTINGGLNWDVQQPLALFTENITDIYFASQNTAWAGIASFQKILKTTNGGDNWGYQNIPTGRSDRISILDTSLGWLGQLGISKTTNGGGNIIYSGIQQISNEIPRQYKLYQNYPNPFNPTTNIKYQILKSTFVKLTIYDILGREIETLVSENQRVGTYLADWNAENYPSGIYYYKLITENYTETKKMILIK